MSRSIPGAILALVLATSGSGQEKGSLGAEVLAGASTASVGVRWHLSKRFALRPSVSGNRSSVEQDTTVIADNTSAVGTQASLDWNLGVGLAGLFYLTEGEGLSTYVGLSYAYTRETDTVNPLIFPPIDSISTPTLARLEQSASVFAPGRTTGTANVVGALFGAQHAISKKVTLFGEVGLKYASQSVRQQVNLPTADSVAVLSGSGSSQKTLFSYTGGLGVIFYLK